jgi:hypothetical protein
MTQQYGHTIASSAVITSAIHIIEKFCHRRIWCVGPMDTFCIHSHLASQGPTETCNAKNVAEWLCHQNPLAVGLMLFTLLRRDNAT